MDHHPSPYQKKILWRALTGVSLFVIIALSIVFIWSTGKVLSYLQPVLIPLAVAGVIAYLLDPIVVWFQKKGMSRLKAVLCVFASFLCAALIFLAIIVPPIVSEASAAIKDRDEIGEKLNQSLYNLKEVSWIKPVIAYLMAPADVEDPDSSQNQADTDAITEQEQPKAESSSDLMEPAEKKMESITQIDKQTSFSETRIGVALRENSNKITSGVTSLLSKSTGKIMASLGLLVGFIMIPIYLYYFLTESAAIKENWHHYVPLKDSKFKTEVVSTLQEINGYLIAFFRGQVLVAFIDGILVGVALWAFGLPYGLVLGVLMAFLGVIPFVGNLICMIPACIIAYVHFAVPENQHISFLGTSPWAYMGAVLAIFLIVQQINSLVTAPKIVGDSVGLHPMTVIFSMLFWSLLLGGFIGALLAVPLTAAVKVIFVRYVWEKRMAEEPDDEDDPETSQSEETPLTAT